ncbi:MAG: TasA family protein [Firmicutes bacterium]|nr:TasA family protein [Bacillota bacterium]
MSNTKATKRALLLSVMAMLVCVAMLVGTTFAWFTDSASTAVNKIQAGTLDVGLEMKDAEGNWVDAEGETLGWVAADGREQDQILWEPGCTYQLPDLRLVNYGTLWLKVKVYINGVIGDAKLLEAIEFTATYETEDGDSIPLTIGTDGAIIEFNDEAMFPESTTGENYIKIKGHMKESAGNEYQGLSIYGIGITVVATQYTYENDSTDNTYDSTAEYDTVTVTAEELAAVMTPDANGVINLEKNYIVTDAWTSLTFGISSVVINGNGHTISGINKPLLSGNAASDITINELTISSSSIGIAANENGLGTAAFVSYMDANTSATFKKCRLVNSSVTGNERAAALVSFASCGTLTIEDCTVENCEIQAVGGTGGLVGYSQNATIIKNSSVKNTSVTSTEDRLGTKTPLAGGVIGTVGGATTFTNVTATNVTVSNNNAGVDVYSDMIGRITGSGSIAIN